MAHGPAASAAVALLVRGTIGDACGGVAYRLAVGMLAITAVRAAPVAWAVRRVTASSAGPGSARGS